MEVEKDLIKREIQKLNLLLNSLIDKISGINSNNAKSGIGEINKDLKNKFDLSLDKITQMENSELIKHISELHESHAEKIVELLYEIVMKTESLDFGENYEKRKIAQKAITIIDFLNQKSETFSMKRINMKNVLQQRRI
ncbi:hypothetical protein [uncultured Algibacter sp.]|uniref:hypothetical protein n=1 Tax=uncultured Algibacter sp. TaxID=298659 RepID=UPI0030EEF851|tara:strand:- start:554 stop:970 length:417 start_codon:yes stop_codon:yes gene_type:complete